MKFFLVPPGFEPGCSTVSILCTITLSDLKADKIMYKACPTEKCNKSVVDLGTGNYRCEKCAQEFANFHWRYILRGAIADPTDYQVNHRGGFRLEPIKNSFFIRLQHFAFLSGSKQNEKGIVVPLDQNLKRIPYCVPKLFDYNISFYTHLEIPNFLDSER